MIYCCSLFVVRLSWVNCYFMFFVIVCCCYSLLLQPFVVVSCGFFSASQLKGDLYKSPINHHFDTVSNW
jgi:hypothetical protein